MRWAVLAVLAAAAAQAAPTHRLQYAREGAESCPDEAALRRAVAERLGVDPFGPEAPQTVAVRLSRRGEGLSADISLLDAKGATTGQRQLSSANRDCVELAKAAALAVAIVIDPMVLARPEPAPAPGGAPAPAVAPTPAPPPPEPDLEVRGPLRPMPAPPPPPAVPPLVAEPSPPPPPPSLVGPPVPSPASAPTGWPGAQPVQVPQVSAPASPPVGPPTAVLLGAGAALTVGQLPTPALALQLDGTYEGTWWALGARVTATMPATTWSISPGSVQAMGVDAGPVGCLRTRRLGGCLWGRLGATPAWASGYTGINASQVVPAVALALQPFVDAPMSSEVRLRFHAALQVNLVMAVLEVGQGVAWRAPPVSFWLGASVAFRAFGESLP